MNIAWAYFLSAGLTLTLIVGLALLYFPELFPTHLVKRWAQHFHYFGH
jgi:amino acid transporter